MFGSSLSVRSFVRLGSFQLYAGSTRVISATDAGTGTLHGRLYLGIRLYVGTWTADVALTTSDRRLKRSITPLFVASKPTGEEWAPDREGPASQLLRELRPVAFKSESEVDAERRRFGFIAQVKGRTLFLSVTNTRARGASD
ncbi:hypothetical protein FOZ60_014796 [Perkinsus olseni]|uniref:Peptidase S74 domain-containing protein n=1 Tax=Perkinsus olseni TaxID=32597 RepID=A0A7J6P8V4_PEROL|nr:hypothetical protein FOZ60_014796 [Perkinsus olseni]